MDFKLPQRKENSNKSTYGRVLNIAGSDYMLGAAYLSSLSALKVGCGYCFLATTEKVKMSVAAKTSSVVFVDPKDFISNLKSADVVSIGCGLSTKISGQIYYKKFLNNLPKTTPIIVDADGLNLISQKPNEFIKKEFEKIIFTPHPKEAARLLGCRVEEVLADIEGSAQKITKKYNCVTVLKTNKTYVCSNDSRCYLNDTGNCAMAKAGSGDVLTGIISGLVAQGMDLFEGAALGVYLHGLCGDFAKEKLTKYSVLAEDLISFIPNVINFYLSK